MTKTSDGLGSHVLAEAIEAINISDEGEALVGAIDFRVGETITIEQQADPGAAGILGWEDRWIAHYASRGWPTNIETIFRVQDMRYATLNLPRITS